MSTPPTAGTHPKSHLIVSDDTNPPIAFTPGKKYQVVTVDVADPKLAQMQKVGSRLCGGTSTCIAVFEID